MTKGMGTVTSWRLGDIRPNPFRNIERYPINRDKVEKLKESIGRTDFWDNLVARVAADGKPEIGYGHHRMVALREMYPPDHEINLIVRDLDDAAMLHVMADENMQEWKADAAVINETVRAVRDFLTTERQQIRNGKRGHPIEPASAQAVAAFLGWDLWKVRDALSVVTAEEAGILRPEDSAGLAPKHADVMRRQVSRISDPAVRSQAVKAVRAAVLDGGKGFRDIGDVVREVRQQAAPPAVKPVVPSEVARTIYTDIDNFWRIGVHLNGQGTLTREQVIRLIAQNRDAEELQGLSKSWAAQIADALDEMAGTAQRLAEALRAEAVEALA